MNGALILLIASSCASADEVWPMPEWDRATPAEVGMNEAKLSEAREYALSRGGSGYVTRRGRLVMAWGDAGKLYDLKSTTKSIGVTALGLAIGDGLMSLDDKAVKHHPAFGFPPEDNRKTGWLDEITLAHLATQTAGFDKPGGYQPLLFRPGTKWHYSDGGPNWLAECVTRVYRRDLDELMFDRVFTPLGIQRSDLRWRQNSYRPHEFEGVARREFGSGVFANVDAMARIGYLYLRGGRWRNRQILPRSFVDAARTTKPEVVGLAEVDPENHGNASDHYGLLWWNNGDGRLKGVPRDAYWSWGLYDSLILVVPSLDVVVSRTSRTGRDSPWQRDWGGHYDVLAPFFGPIVASITGNSAAKSEPETAAPYPPSPVITKATWAPVDTIVRRAAGSDNWPTTWADDGDLYTAYGDGWGFDPRVPDKLSLGFAKVTGGPTDFLGTNVRSPSGETRGDGPRGKKASGMLMVDGVLYMWVRNADASQLAWSADRARTWTFSDWRFETTFGCPTLLNFGPNYQGARDEYVYLYSPDTTTAYEPADQMVLARVHRDRIAKREAYEFFVRLDTSGRPVWSGDIEQRGAVFSDPGRSGRSLIGFDGPLKRYLWVHVLHGDDTRTRTGLAIYDAPEPWGPWTTVYFAPTWDTNPGETAGFPTKWISRDGKTLHLVFSGEDSFSVRKVVLTTTFGVNSSNP